MKQLLKILYVLYYQTAKSIPVDNIITIDIPSYYKFCIIEQKAFGGANFIEFKLINRNTNEILLSITLRNFTRVINYTSHLKPKKAVKMLLNISFHYTKNN